MNRWHYESRNHVRENINAIAIDTIRRIIWEQPTTQVDAKVKQIEGIMQLVFLIEESINAEESNDANP